MKEIIKSVLENIFTYLIIASLTFAFSFYVNEYEIDSGIYFIAKYFLISFFVLIILYQLYTRIVKKIVNKWVIICKYNRLSQKQKDIIKAYFFDDDNYIISYVSINPLHNNLFDYLYRENIVHGVRGYLLNDYLIEYFDKKNFK